jgi:hypothetical protein
MKEMGSQSVARRTGKQARIARMLAEYERVEGVRLRVVSDDEDTAREINTTLEQQHREIDAESDVIGAPFSYVKTGPIRPEKRASRCR